jgi:hypothetical protein
MAGARAASAISGVALALALSAAAPAATQTTAIPKLGYSEFGWFPDGDDFRVPETGPGPVVSDPAHPYYSNQSGRQATDRVAALDNPNLKPWVAESLKKANQVVLAGHTPFNPRERCMPAGVPAIDVYSRLRPVYFLQEKDQVTIVNEGDAQVRRIYLNVPHSKNPKPSWYGESVGHYENGDTLVIDTIGMNDKTFVDNYLTPHTTALHVVERFKLLPDGETIEMTAMVDDPKAFNAPWSGIQIYRRRPQDSMQEAICTENPTDYFGQNLYPLPHAEKPDF